MKIEKIIRLVIIALLIREIFSFWTGHPYDFEMFARVGEQLFYGKPLYIFIGPYEDISFWPYENVGYAYPPLFAYFCLLAYTIYKVMDINIPYIYYFILKQPMIIGDVLCGYLIYKVNKKYFNKEDINTSLIWLFNPITIVFSSIWGIPHALAIFFILLFLYNFYKQFIFIYLLIFFLIIGLPFIYFLPYLAIEFKKRKNFRYSLILFFIIAILLPILSLIPFQLQNQLINITMAVEDVFFKKALGQFNMFMIFNYLYYLDSRTFSNFISIAASFIPYLWFPILIFFTIIYKIRINNFNNFIEFSKFFFIITIIFLIFRQNVNEQYMLYFLSLCLINFNLIENKHFKRLFLLIQINTLLFILTNNPFLLRFATPLNQEFYFIDISLTSTEPLRFLRLTLMTIFGCLNTLLLILFLRRFNYLNKLKNKINGF